MEEENNNGFIFEKQALRVSVLPYYNCGDLADVKDYMKGKIFNENYNQEWCTDLKKWKSAGKKIQRIRVLPNKINDYNRFETMVWQFNQNAGEEYLIIKEDDYKQILKKYNIPGDFWIFDNKKVMKLFYDENNDFTHNEITTESVQKYLDFYNDLLTKTISLKTVLINFRKNISKII